MAPCGILERVAVGAVEVQCANEPLDRVAIRAGNFLLKLLDAVHADAGALREALLRQARGEAVRS